MSGRLAAPLPLAPAVSDVHARGAGQRARGLVMANAPALRLPAQHFVAALLFLSAGSLGLVWIAPELAAGLYLSPHVAAVTHCFTLGWLTTTIFGALYQLLPVALGTPIRSERWGHVSFWCHAPGVALFVSGIATGSQLLRHLGVALIATGILCIAINVSLSLRASSERDVIWAAIATAQGFLVATLGIGLLLVHNLHTGILGGARVRVLALHLHIAMIGWVLIMIVGISQRLLPMFLLGQVESTRLARYSVALLAMGLLALTAGLLGAPATQSATTTWLAWTGVVAIDAGVFCYLAQVLRIYRARARPRLDAGLRHVAVALMFIVVSAALGPIVLSMGNHHPGLAIAYVMLALLGGLTMFAIGQFYKIVPFLIWISRFRQQMGRRRVPTIAEMFSARVAHCGLVSLSLAIVTLAAGALLGSAAMVRAGAWLFVSGVALFMSQMRRAAFMTGEDADLVVAARPPRPTATGAG